MTKTETAIDYYKYLNCHDCKKLQFYCTTHKIEVDKILILFRDAFSVSLPCGFQIIIPTP